MASRRTLPVAIALTIIAGAFVIGALVGHRAAPIHVENQASKEVIPGTHLQSFIKKEPYTVFVNPNDPAEFAIFRKDRWIVYQYLEDGVILRNYFENDSTVLTLTLDEDEEGVALEKVYIHNDAHGDMQVSYFDTNNDGIWDKMHDMTDRKEFIWGGERWEEKQHSLQRTKPDSPEQRRDDSGRP